MTNPIIRLAPDVEIALTAWAIATQGREFSGLGLIERENEMITVVQVDLLGVGSSGFTEFDPKRQLALPEDPRRKLWFHRHPIGSGVPGPENWSGTDVHTATQEPLGSIPQLVQWSVAIVMTPKGWVGRVDFHVPTTRTFHCAVEPNIPSEQVVAQARELMTPELQQYINQLLDEYYAGNRRPQSRVFSEFDLDEPDPYEEWAMDPSGYEPSDYYCANQECATDQIQLVEMDTDTGEIVGIGLEVTAYLCPKCGEEYYTQKSNAIEIRPEPPHKVKSHRDWRRSFNTWMDKRR